MTGADKWREALARALWVDDHWEGDPGTWGELHETVRDDYRRHADALSPVLAQMKREWQAEAWGGAADKEGPANAWPTPPQWLAMLRDVTPEDRLRVAGRVIADAQIAAECFQRDHETAYERGKRDGAAEALREAADEWLDSDDPNAYIAPDRWLRDRAAALGEATGREA